jgi:4-hydroxy-2-oxoheptanedioate aldolase
MRSSKIRARLRQNQAVRFPCLYYPTSMMPAHAARAGFDAIWLDAEHSTWERRELQRMIALHHLADIDCIVRTGSRNPNELYHLLEDGATALMIPMVNTPEEAKFLVNATKFYPLGQRGIDGAGMDNNFYLDGVKNYTANANAETFLILQIETPEAVARVEEIAAIPGVDGFFVGPGDLSTRMGCAPDWKLPQMAAAQTKVAAAAAKHGIAWGRPTRDVADIRDLQAAGGRLIAHGSDFGAVFAMMAQYGKNLTEALG